MKGLSTIKEKEAQIKELEKSIEVMTNVMIEKDVEIKRNKKRNGKA